VPRQNIQIRTEALLRYIQAYHPTRLEILSKLYSLSDAGRRKFQRDLDTLREAHEIIHDDEGRYALLQTARTGAILAAILSQDERTLLARVQQEFQPGHPYLTDVQLLLDKLAGQLSERQQQLERTAPTAYFGPRFARDYTEYRPTIQELEQAIRQMQRVRFVNARPVSREIEAVPHFEVEPQFLQMRNGTLYLYGYSIHRERCYYYRIDKIKELKTLPAKFGVFRNPLAYMLEFEYLLHPSLVKGGISERFYRQELIEIRPDNYAHLRAWEEAFWVKQELLRLGRTAILLSPAHLRAELAAEIEEMHRFYHEEV